jgi:hypothetical protein
MDITETQWNKLWQKATRGGPDDCWEWKGAKSSGTPMVFIGVPGTPGRTISARKIIWEQTRGEDVPAGSIVTNSCQNRLCVNPNHIIVVTRREHALRNGSPTALNSQRETCKNGHPFTEENTYLRKDGRGRQCRTCAREQVAKHRKRKVKPEPAPEAAD